MAYQGGYGGQQYGNQQQGGYGGYQPGAPGGYSGGPPGGHPGGHPGSYRGGPPGGYQGQAPGGYQGQQAPGGYPTGGSGNYAGAQGGYAAPPGAFPPQNAGVSPDAQRWFDMVDRDHSGKINVDELKAALVNGKGEHFSDNSCKLMIGMFDKDASGTIDIYEFEKLYNYINQWLQVFKTYDRDQSGHIDESELQQAFNQMGFRFSPEFIKFLIKKSDPTTNREISVDQFIVLCVQIQRFTEAFRARDTDQKGIISIAFEDFLSVAIGCSY